MENQTSSNRVQAETGREEAAVKQGHTYLLSIISALSKIIGGGVMIFLLAGSIYYVQGWVFLGIGLLITLAALVVMRKSKALVKERMQPGKDAKKWDKVLVKFYTLAIVISLVIAVLDTGRFYWSPAFPLFVYGTAYLLLFAGGAFAFWAMRTNAYFSSIVRIQSDRGHTVIKEGPYKWVRHPGYTGLLVSIICIPLVFGSTWGLIPAALADLLLIIRTGIEDKTLQKELPGYVEYTKEVRYRLLPLIW